MDEDKKGRFQSVAVFTMFNYQVGANGAVV